jgi:hypothetical protein
MKRIWQNFRVVGGLGAALGLVAGCAHSSAEQGPVTASQAQSQKDLQASVDAQRSALEQQKRTDEAQVQAEKLKAELAAAQTKAQAEREKAIEEQKKAIQLSRENDRKAESSQQQALISQNQAQKQLLHQVSAADGLVTRVRPHEIDVARSSDQTPITMEVNDSTKLELNGKQVALADIPEGIAVHVNFRMGTLLPIATRVQAGVVPTNEPLGTGGGGSAGK